MYLYILFKYFGNIFIIFLQPFCKIISGLVPAIFPNHHKSVLYICAKHQPTQALSGWSLLLQLYVPKTGSAQWHGITAVMSGQGQCAQNATVAKHIAALPAVTLLVKLVEGSQTGTTLRHVV